MHTILKSVLARTLALAVAFITGSALAATPVAVWEGDLADNSTKNNITLTLNGNSVANGVVTIDQTKGVQFYNNNFNSRAITVIFKYSELDTSSTTSRSLVTVGGGNNSTATGSNNDYLGLYALNGATAKGIVSGAAWGGNDAAGNSKGNFSTAGVIAIAYNYDNGGTRGYMDGSLVYEAGGLKGQNMYTRFIGVGGNYVTTGDGKLAAATGLKIEAVAIFNSALGANEIAAYKWPSENEFYAKWKYANHVYTWKAPSNAGAFHNGPWSIFDLDFCYDTGVNSTAGWNADFGAVTAPGNVMRYETASYCQSSDAQFNPLTFGGIIVEEGATGYSVVGNSGDNRPTKLGDTAGQNESWFVFKEGYTINRTGSTTFFGVVNVEVAEGKVFDCNSAQTARTVDFDTATAAVLKMHGGGTLKVATLTATGAVTLDYSAQTLERLAEGTPYIAGTLAVDASTTIVLPEDAEAGVQYKLATTIQGDAVGVLKLGEAALPEDATVVINQNAGTIGFVEGTFDQAIDGETLFSTVTWPQDHTPTAADLVTFNLATDAKLTLDAPFQYMALDLNCTGNASVIVDSALTTPVTITGVEGAKLTLGKTANAAIAQSIIVSGFSEIEIQGEFGVGEVVFGTTSIILGEGASITVNGATDATFEGEGQVVFAGVTPSAAAKTIFQDSTQWTGTVWLKNLSLINADFDMDNYGNASSKIKLTGITGYAAQASNPGAIDCSVEVELVDEDETLAVDLNNGFSNIANQPANICTYTFAKITGSGTFKNSGGSCSPQYRFVDVSDFTGKLWVASNMRFAIGDNAAFGDSTKITIDGDATIGCALQANGGVVVAEGVALTIPVAEGETKIMPVTVDESNTIKVSGTTGSLVYDAAKLPTFDFSEAGDVELRLVEHVGWDGSVDVRFAGAEAIPDVVLVRADGTEITDAVKTPSGSTVTYQFAPLVDSSSAWYAWEFEGTLASVGKEKTTMGKDYGPFYNPESNAVYAISQPYATVNYPDEFTASIYGTLPETNNAVLVAFGTIGAGGVALAAGDPAKQEVKIVYWPGKPVNPEACVELAKMTVPNAFTSDHLYLFTKTADGIKVYLDGTLVINYGGTYTFGSGIQVGTIHGGIGNTGLGRLQVVYGTPVETNVLCHALINSLRVYDAALGPKAIELIADELGYVSPNGTFERTLGGNANFLSGAADWTKVGDGAVDAPAENATLELTANAASELTINVEGTFNAEALTVKGDEAVTFKRGTGMLNNAGVTTIATPVTVEYGALDISGNAVTMLEGGSLTFDYSTFELEQLPYVTTYYHATGLINGEATPTAVNLPTLDEGWTCSFELDTATSQWGLKVIPPHEAGETFTWVGGVYPEIELTLGADEEKYSLSDLFPGDKIQLAGDRDYETTTTPEYALVCASDWSGVLKKVGAGEAIFNLGAGFTNDLIIAAGTAKIGANYGFGNYTLTSAQVRQIVVEAGATADLNGVVDQCLAFVLNGGTLVNTGINIGDNNRQAVSITLTADSYVGGTGNFGLHGSGNAATALNLDSFTLTKTGSNAFDLVNATVNGSGTLKVEAGSVRARVANSAGGSDWTLDLAAGATLDLVKSLMVGTLTGDGSVTGTEVLSVVTLADYCLVPANAAFAPDATIRLTGANTIKDSSNWIFYSGVTLDSVNGASLTGEGVLIPLATKTDTTLTAAFKDAVRRGGKSIVFTENGLELVKARGFQLILR